jgi:hypothetical protein
MTTLQKLNKKIFPFLFSQVEDGENQFTTVAADKFLVLGGGEMARVRGMGLGPFFRLI